MGARRSAFKCRQRVGQIFWGQNLRHAGVTPPPTPPPPKPPPKIRFSSLLRTLLVFRIRIVRVCFLWSLPHVFGVRCSSPAREELLRKEVAGVRTNQHPTFHIPWQNEVIKTYNEELNLAFSPRAYINTSVPLTCSFKPSLANRSERRTPRWRYPMGACTARGPSCRWRGPARAASEDRASCRETAS